MIDRPARAFSLLELLVVLGIISILALIALPNFRLAQVRAKVSRVKADLTTVATALETYHVDHGVYPPNNLQQSGRFTCTGAWGPLALMPSLTTPVAYLTNNMLEDPFARGSAFYVNGQKKRVRLPLTYHYAKSHKDNNTGPQYMIYSMGPAGRPLDRLSNAYAAHVLLGLHGREYFDACEYNPAQGTVSRGYIIRCQQ